MHFSVLFLTMIWFVPASSWAGEVLNFSDAVQMAYDQNPQIIQAKKAIVSREGDVLSARALPNPRIEAAIGGDDTTAFKQSFDPLGTRFLKTQIAQNEVRIQEEAVKSLWSDIYLDVRATYQSIALDKKELELQNSNVRSMRQFFSHVQMRYEGGQAMKNHFQHAKIELLKAESDYLEAENRLNIDRARLNILLGRPREIIFDVIDEFKEEQLTQSLESLTGIALAQRPDLKMEQVQLDSKRKNVNKDQLNRLPSFSLGFEHSKNKEERDNAFLVEVSIPLWGLNQGEVKKAAAERDAQQVKLEAMKNEIGFEVYAAYQDVQLSLKQQKLFKKSLEEANELFRLAGLKYGEGKIDFTDYLNEVKASMDSRLRYYQGLYRLSQSISALEKSIYSSLRGEEFLK